MPNITIYGIETEVDVDVDIDVDEFLDDCSDKDIKEVIEWLKDEGHLEDNNARIPVDPIDNPMDIIYKEALNKLYNKRINLSLEEEEFIINLANKL
jgi:endo-1,4-beta-mannosidase